MIQFIFYGSFKHAIGSWDHIESNAGIIIPNNWMEKACFGTGRCLIWGIIPEFAREIEENHESGSQEG
jgi:hypothetical protein